MPDSFQKFDINILFYIQEHIKSPALDKLMVFFTELGNAGIIWVAAAIILLYFKQYRKCGIYLAIALVFTSLLGDEVLKIVFHRIRPCNIYPQVPLLIVRPLSYSFPSGHTMVGFSAATMLFYHQRYFGLAGYFIAFLIAFSRVYLFVHYPTDIFGGIIFGITTCAVLIYGLNKISSILKPKDPDTAK